MSTKITSFSIDDLTFEIHRSMNKSGDLFIFRIDNQALTQYSLHYIKNGYWDAQADNYPKEDVVKYLPQYKKAIDYFERLKAFV
jgi:hypothetical protein